MAYRDDLIAAIRRADSLEDQLRAAETRIKKLEAEQEALRKWARSPSSREDSKADGQPPTPTVDQPESTTQGWALVIAILMLIIVLGICCEGCLFC